MENLRWRKIHYWLLLGNDKFPQAIEVERWIPAEPDNKMHLIVSWVASGKRGMEKSRTPNFMF